MDGGPEIRNLSVSIYNMDDAILIDAAAHIAVKQAVPQTTMNCMTCALVTYALLV